MKWACRIQNKWGDLRMNPIAGDVEQFDEALAAARAQCADGDTLVQMYAECWTPPVLVPDEPIRDVLPYEGLGLAPETFAAVPDDPPYDGSAVTGPPTPESAPDLFQLSSDPDPDAPPAPEFGGGGGFDGAGAGGTFETEAPPPSE